MAAFNKDLIGFLIIRQPDPYYPLSISLLSVSPILTIRLRFPCCPFLPDNKEKSAERG
jgi:hypothetical protein